MSTIDDLLTAINEYPSQHVTIDVTNFQEPDGHINVGENCTFNVRVENNGNLDMRNVRLHVYGSAFASVALTGIFGLPGSFGSSVISGPRNIDAHASATFGVFHMHADAATPDGGKENRELFTVHISSFDADLEHILRDHGHHAASPEEAYVRHIHPS